MRRFIILLLCVLCVSAKRGLQDKVAKDGGSADGSYKNSYNRGKGSMGMHAVSRDVPLVPTLSPVSSVAPIASIAPTPTPVSFAIAPPTPITVDTSKLVESSFIPGGTQDMLAANTSRSLLGEFFEFSGQLQVVDGGIVSLAPLSGIIAQITCDQPNKAIQVDFHAQLGQSQIGFLFPEGATLAISSDFFGSCLLGPETLPPGVVKGFHNSSRFFPAPGVGSGDAFLVIGEVHVHNDYTAIIHGQTGTFFNMFSEGNLSIKRLSQPGRFLTEDDSDHWDGEEELEDYAGRRKLNIQQYNAFLDTENAFVSTLTRLVEDGQLDDLQASWDASGIVMNANVNMEFIATYDLLASVYPGPVAADRIDEQNFPAFNASLVPDVLSLFQGLSSYALPGVVMDFFSESPLFVELDDGFVATQLEYFSRLRYSTGRKKFSFSATGAWDDLVVGAIVTETSPGRFSSSNFRVAFDPNFVSDPDAPPFPNSFNIFAGVTAQLEIYGSLFSGNCGVDIGVQFTSANAPDGGNFPPLISDDIEIAFDGRCDLCPPSIVNAAARAGELILEINLGFYVDTDLVGPSSANTPANLQFSYIDPTSNPSAFVERAVYCLDSQYGDGANETLSCGDRCCDGGSGEICDLINETEGVCALQ